MTINRLCIWFIGSFVGAALSVWLDFHWAIGAGVGAMTGIVLTVWRELIVLIAVILHILYRSDFTLMGWMVRVVHRIKTQPQLRRKALYQLYEWIPISHALALVAFPVFLLLCSDDPALAPAPYLVLAFLVLAGPLEALKVLIVGEEVSEQEDENIKEKIIKERKEALRYNIATFPFWLVYRLGSKVVQKVRNTDLSAKWSALVRAFHSKSALPAGIFCAVGALSGYLFGNPWLGGLVGMVLGCIEYVLVRKYAPWALCPAN